MFEKLNKKMSVFLFLFLFVKINFIAEIKVTSLKERLNGLAFMFIYEADDVFNNLSHKHRKLNIRLKY